MQTRTHFKLHRIIVTMLVAAVISSCSTVAGDESMFARSQRQIDTALAEMGVTVAEPVGSVSNFTLRSFNAINEYSLVVTSGQRKHYLILLATWCPDLNFAFTIAFDSRIGANITPMDAVVVSSLNRRPERCPIAEIYRLDDVSTEAR